MMKKKLAFLVLALVLLAGAQVMAPATAEAAPLTCFRVCQPVDGSSDCVCCQACCTRLDGSLSCIDIACDC